MQGIDRRDVFAGLAAAMGLTGAAQAKGAKEIFTGKAIHQDIAFTAAPARVYAVLTTASEFDKVVRASDAMSTVGPMLKAHPTAIEARPGGAFTLFGGYISGFNLELSPAQKLVQAWRSQDWAPGKFSIAQFTLAPAGAGTKLSFDQTGFPADDAAHLVEGWYGNYWKPMAKVLTQ